MSRSSTNANTRLVWMLWLIAAATWYYWLLNVHIVTIGGGSNARELTFNSMLIHLLQGKLDVDPNTIGNEGFRFGEKVYTYFGIFPALLRMPLLFAGDFARTDITLLSCFVANCLMAAAKATGAAIIWRRFGNDESAGLLPPFRVVSFLSGAQILFLQPSIYVEVCLWANVFASSFVLLVLYAWLNDRGFTTRILNGLAALAGLCLLTRVSTAIGLWCSFALIVGWMIFYAEEKRIFEKFRTKTPYIMPSVLILAIFAGITGIVN